MFAAGVGGFDGSEMGRHVVAVNAVDESEARFAGEVGVFDDGAPNLISGPEVTLIDFGVFPRLVLDFGYII